MKRRGSSGQVLVIVALLSAVLVGIVGLSIDGGEAAGEQALVQASADGAALAAAYDAGKNTTQAVATALATQVVQNDGLAANTLTVSYLNAGGGVVAGPGTAGVVTVQATVLETRATFFLAALGVPNFRVTATARASTAGAVAAPCAVCVIPASGATYHQFQNSTVTVSGAPLVVNSTSGGNLTVDKKSNLTAPSILLGSLKQSVSGSASVTPNPVVGTAADPLAAIAYPTIVGAQPNVTNTSGTNALAPGIYQNITVSGGTLTMTGSFVVTGTLKVSAGGTLNATGALIFLGCSGYPTACPAATSGGVITTTGGTVNLTAKAGGTYAGLAVFADRNNTAADSFVNTALTVVGTYYTAGAGVTFDNATTALSLQSEVIVASLDIAAGTTVTIAYTAAQNASPTALALAP